MLRRDPRLLAQGVVQPMVLRWRSGPSRVRLRRRLLLFSAPVVIVALVAAYKMISVVIAGNAAQSDFARHDTDALRGDISTLGFLNVIDPETVPFWQGDLAALQGDLGAADSRFSHLLSQTEVSGSCPVRVNLELVKETQGDLAARDIRIGDAQQRYTAALVVVKDAPKGCFQGNSDSDEDRRRIRNDAAARLADKIRALHTLPSPSTIPSQPPPASAMPVPVPPPPPPPPPPPGAPGSGGDAAAPSNVNPDRLPGSGPVPALRLEPGGGDPVGRLQQALENSQASGQNGE